MIAGVVLMAASVTSVLPNALVAGVDARQGGAP
jgi:hypothetical protein